MIVGDDDHEKSALALALGEMVEEDLRAFNVERLYAVDAAVTPIVVAEAARTLPMIAPRRVVIVLQAEKLFDPKKKRKSAEQAADEEEPTGSLEPLIDYLEDPAPTTALAFVFSTPEGAKSPADIPLAKNLKVTKSLLKAATLVVCTGLDGGKDPGRWIEQQATAAGLSVERNVVSRIVQLSAGDAGRLRADVEKLLLFADRGRAADAGARGCGGRHACPSWRRLGAGTGDRAGRYGRRAARAAGGAWRSVACPSRFWARSATRSGRHRHADGSRLAGCRPPSTRYCERISP